MPFLYTTRPYTEQEKQDAITRLTENSLPDRDFYLLVSGAILFALCAILTDSVPLLIGSMILAPLAYPILAGGLGIAVMDGKLFLRSCGMLAIALVAAIIFAYIGTLILGPFRVDPVSISFITQPFFDVFVALLAGAIAAYGLLRLKVGGAMTGIGIAVSLMPPLVATGVACADMAYGTALHAFTIFVLNVIGIFLASVVVFSCFDMRSVYKSLVR